jgi:hypothetical protein
MATQTLREPEGASDSRPSAGAGHRAGVGWIRGSVVERRALGRFGFAAFARHSVNAMQRGVLHRTRGRTGLARHTR